jgi:hypothetical protein
MFVLPFLSMLLLFLTPALIFAGWFVLFLCFGLSGEIIKRTSWLIDPQADSVARGESWLTLAMGIFILSTMLFVSLLCGALMQESQSSQTYVSGERAPSLGVLVFTFIYSPIALLLVIEAWLSLLNYFGLHYLLHRLKVSIDQVQCPKTISMTVLQFLTIVTGLVGFGWWCNLDPARREAIFHFSFIILSPTTVLLTFGLVVMLFFSLNKIPALEENIEQHQQIARRMVFVLLSTLILLGLVGGILSLLIHLNPFSLPSIT